MECITPNAFLQPILENGMDGLADVLRILLNEAMKIERENVLNASHYQRCSERIDYAKGYKPKQIQTRYGKLNVDVPQTRNCDFYPSCLEKGIRSERAISIALAEMYFHGVATRSVTAILEKMCGLDVSAMQVSRATQKLDDEFDKWRNRPILAPVSFLLLDARYEKVREDGAVFLIVRRCLLLMAWGKSPVFSKIYHPLCRLQDAICCFIVKNISFLCTILETYFICIDKTQTFK